MTTWNGRGETGEAGLMWGPSEATAAGGDGQRQGGAGRARGDVWVARLVWAVAGGLAVLLAINCARFAYNAYLSAIFPGQMDYAEGIVWQQALLIPGPRMYGDLQQYPFLVFHYPPFYHLVVRAVATLGNLSWLFAGRMISLVSTFALAALAGTLVFEATRRAVPRRAALAGALLAALLFSTFSVMQFWARTMRVDMLAAAIEFLGLYLGLVALSRPRLRLLYAAFLVFVLAAYTKQTALGGAAATFLAALAVAPGRAIRAAGLAFLAGGAVFAGLMAVTGGGFARHIILYNVNRFSLAAAFTTLHDIGAVQTYPIYLVIAAAVAALSLVRFAREWRRPAAVPGPEAAAPPSLGPAVFALYFLLATANLVALGKSGAWSNYLIPWMSSWALLIGVAAAHACSALVARPAQPLAALLLLVLLAPQVVAAPTLSGERRLIDPEFRREHDELLAMIERANKPVFSDDMTLLMETGREVPWEPSIISELSAKGLFDERQVVSLIEQHAFAFMVVWGEPGNPWFDARHSPAVTAAIEQNYPVDRKLAEHHVRLPAGSGSTP